MTAEERRKRIDALLDKTLKTLNHLTTALTSAKH